MEALRLYLTVLMQFANANGTILSDSATSILEALSICKNNRGESITARLEEFTKVFPHVTNHLKNVALKLQGRIGRVAKSFTDAIDEFRISALKYVRGFLTTLKESSQKEVDYEPTQRNC